MGRMFEQIALTSQSFFATKLYHNNIQIEWDKKKLVLSSIKSRYLSILFSHIIFLLLTSISSVFSQPIPLRFVHLTPNDGLSSSITLSLLQDYRGFVWIGTDNGLNRYDGINFVLYKNDPVDSSSLSENYVITIFEDHEKNLFVGNHKGLCLYDRKKDNFLNFMLDKSSPLRGLECLVNNIAEDSLGNLWLATSIGLIYFDRIKNKIVQYVHDPNNPESISFNRVEAVLIDKKKRIWVSTRKGLNLFQPASGTFKHITRTGNDAGDLSNTIFMDMIEDREGDLWFGSTEGLYCLKNDPNADGIKLTHYQHDKHNDSSLSINQIKSLYVDDTGNLWIGTENGGIDLFDRANQRFWHYRNDDYDPKSLNNESIQAILKDKAGNLWFGTFAGGLNVAMKNREAINNYQTLPGVPSSLSHNAVVCFLEDQQGQIWVGTDGGGLNLFEPQVNRFAHFNIDNSKLSSNSILCLLEGHNHKIWLGTWAGGLVQFDPKAKTFTSFTTKNSGIQDDNIFTIAEGDDNDLWLGSFEHGLIHYQIKERKFTGYTPENSGLANDMVVKISKLSNRRLLIGNGKNLQIFSPDENHFKTYMNEPNNANSLSSNSIIDILVENDSCVWIGTLDGLNRFNPNTGSFKRYYEKDGLPSNVIKGLVLDQSGVLWVTTNSGACRFDYKRKKVKTFIKADGLQGNEFSERSILKTKSGTLLMGGTKGFDVISPEKIVENNSIPNVLITDLQIFNKSVKPNTENSPLVENITETKTLTLSHKQSVLTFYFSVLDFSTPEKNQCAYMMENFDTDWTYPKNKREATYTNLDPGEYVFRVKGSNSDGVWNEMGTSIKITILPPWWQTMWFKLIAIFTIIFILGFIYLSRIRNLKNQKILLEKLVAIKTTELNDLNASKDKFFSIIAHDLKNPFNAIIGFSEILKEEIKSGDLATVEEFAGLINISAVQTLRLLENLLEWANSQRGKIVFNPIPINLRELFNEEFDMLNDMAKVKNIELKSSFPGNLTVVADKNMLKTILRNLVSNAIKFTHKNGKVEVKAVINNKHAEISVSDNGIGMTNDAMAKLFRIDTNQSTYGTEKETGSGLGLILCKEFVEKHHGKIWVETEVGKGSQFKFTLPLT